MGGSPLYNFSDFRTSVAVRASTVTAARPIRVRSMVVGGSQLTVTPVRRRMLERTAAVQRLLSQGRPQFSQRMTRRELRAEAVVAGAFLAVAIPLAIFA